MNLEPGWLWSQPLGGCRLGGCRLRSTAPRCPQVPFRRQELSQDTASRSTSHDWDPSEDVLFPMPGSNYRQDGSDEPCVAEAAAAGDQPPPPMQHPACQQPPPRLEHERAFAVRRVMRRGSRRRVRNSRPVSVRHGLARAFAGADMALKCQEHAAFTRMGGWEFQKSMEIRANARRTTVNSQASLAG